MSDGQRVGIVGGGIVGLATGRALLARDPSLRLTVLEREPAIVAHQTSHNSGVVHAGVYYTPGSLKARLCIRGVQMLREYCAERGLAYEECGKLIVAADASELPALRALLERGTANGVPGLRWVEQQEMRDIEPHVRGAAGLHSPRTAIVDFAQIARSYAEDCRAAGAEIRTSAGVSAIVHRGGEVRVVTTAGEHTFDRLVTCAGLRADEVARLSGDGEDPRIVPFRGEYHLLRPDRRHLVRGLIYPVPDPRYPFLGIHATKRIDGEIMLGPNAVLAFAREGYRFGTVRPRQLAAILRYPGFLRLARRHWRMGARELRRSLSTAAFVREARRYLPDVTAADVVRGPSGVRAQAVNRDGTLVDDFVITHQGNVVNVRNAPSPAATSSLAIGEAIADIVTGANPRMAPDR